MPAELQPGVHAHERERERESRQRQSEDRQALPPYGEQQQHAAGDAEQQQQAGRCARRVRQLPVEQGRHELRVDFDPGDGAAVRRRHCVADAECARADEGPRAAEQLGRRASAQHVGRGNGDERAARQAIRNSRVALLVERNFDAGQRGVRKPPGRIEPARAPLERPCGLDAGAFDDCGES